uniref:Uncharacterized protein n=1 Tax=uncultured Desulfobacterium sp. TaxID=201089 RepID=E1YB80_9BACT|nr:unknown protein [uncultured Desulfobacterium sp.]
MALSINRKIELWYWTELVAQLPVTTITGKVYNETFINQLTEHIISFALHGLYGKSGEIC